MDITKTLLDKGFKAYKHNSGFIAWSVSNLCEYSDEWEKQKVTFNN